MPIAQSRCSRFKVSRPNSAESRDELAKTPTAILQYWLSGAGARCISLRDALSPRILILVKSFWVLIGFLDGFRDTGDKAFSFRANGENPGFPPSLINSDGIIKTFNLRMLFKFHLRRVR